MSMVLSTVLFGVVVLYRDRPWIRTVLIVVMLVGMLSAVIGTALYLRRARRAHATAPPSREESELRELDKRIDRLMEAAPELRMLVARRDAGEISEEEFVKRQAAILGDDASEETDPSPRDAG